MHFLWEDSFAALACDITTSWTPGFGTTYVWVTLSPWPVLCTRNTPFSVGWTSFFWRQTKAFHPYPCYGWAYTAGGCHTKHDGLIASPWGSFPFSFWRLSLCFLVPVLKPFPTVTLSSFYTKPKRSLCSSYIESELQYINCSALIFPRDRVQVIISYWEYLKLRSLTQGLYFKPFSVISFFRKKTTKFLMVFSQHVLQVGQKMSHHFFFVFFLRT